MVIKFKMALKTIHNKGGSRVSNAGGKLRHLTKIKR